MTPERKLQILAWAGAVAAVFGGFALLGLFIFLSILTEGALVSILVSIVAGGFFLVMLLGLIRSVAKVIYTALLKASTK